MATRLDTSDLCAFSGKKNFSGFVPVGLGSVLVSAENKLGPFMGIGFFESLQISGSGSGLFYKFYKRLQIDLQYPLINWITIN